MNLLTLSKQKRNIRILQKISRSRNLEELEAKYLEYRKFCQDSGLNPMIRYEDLVGKNFILDVTLGRAYSESSDAILTADHLRKVIANKPFVDGISLDECESLLKWVVQNAIEISTEEIGSVAESTSTANSYFLQSITAFPFIDLGLPCTINNTRYFSDDNNSHPFITVSLPIKTDEEVVMKRYLIDISYKQFFLARNCNLGVIYDGRMPDVGYYMCKSAEGIKFATELLRKGYIELTDTNARLYGFGFACGKLKPSDDMMALAEIGSKNGADYIKIMDENQDTLVYSNDNAEFMGASCKFPTCEKTKVSKESRLGIKE